MDSETIQHSYRPETVLLHVDDAPYVEFPGRTAAPRPVFEARKLVVVAVLPPSRPATLVIEIARSDQPFFVRRDKKVRGDEVLALYIELPVPRLAADVDDPVSCSFSILRFDFDDPSHGKAGGRDQ